MVTETNEYLGKSWSIQMPEGWVDWRVIEEVSQMEPSTPQEQLLVAMARALVQLALDKKRGE